MTLPLTERQERLWRYIASCERSPSCSEMALALGDKTRGAGVARTVEALEAKGYIRRTPGRARSIVALSHSYLASSITTAELAAELDRRGLGIVMLPLHGRIS